MTFTQNRLIQPFIELDFGFFCCKTPATYHRNPHKGNGTIVDSVRCPCYFLRKAQCFTMVRIAHYAFLFLPIFDHRQTRRDQFQKKQMGISDHCSNPNRFGKQFIRQVCGKSHRSPIGSNMERHLSTFAHVAHFCFSVVSKPCKKHPF